MAAVSREAARGVRFVKQRHQWLLLVGHAVAAKQKALRLHSRKWGHEKDRDFQASKEQVAKWTDSTAMGRQLEVEARTMLGVGQTQWRAWGQQERRWLLRRGCADDECAFAEAGHLGRKKMHPSSYHRSLSRHD